MNFVDRLANLKAFITLILLSSTFSLVAQNEFRVRILDAADQKPLIGASVLLINSNIGGICDPNGDLLLTNIPNGKQRLQFSYIGYKSLTIEFNFPIEQTGPFIAKLAADESDFDEIVIEATRANRIVANLPTRTEVLTEEIDEAASMEPSKIAHLITHSTGIQVQTTAATSNGAVVRIQGLNGRYTQMLKDGFPLYGGFSGSLDVLQIPPLDLRQVEYIKGSASTLYGGGAIAGLINLLSKTPQKEETLLHINFSHIGSKDFNAFSSKKFGKFGFTNLASLHMHSPYDPDKDGYSDIPDVVKFNFNPKLYYYANDKNEFLFGANISRENRKGGDMTLIENSNFDSTHFYLDNQESQRYTTQFRWKYQPSEQVTFTLKNSISQFDRSIKINIDPFGNRAEFSGKQSNSFSEFNFNSNKDSSNLTLGVNMYTDQFKENELETSALRNQEYLTLGLFANFLWDIDDKWSIESGLRGDMASAKSMISSSNSETFLLPRLSALFKANDYLSFRLGGGMGYRMPTIFNEEAEVYGFQNISAIDFENMEAERSTGANFDFKYRTTFGRDEVLLTFNQMFFYNEIENPITLLSDSSANLYYSNALDLNGNPGNLKSSGFESQIKLTIAKFTWFFGYTYTDAIFSFNTSERQLVLTPKHSIKGDLLFVEDDKWRIGWDYEYKSSQLLSSGRETRALFTTGIIVERTIENFVIFLNAENFTDTRQSNYESLKSGPFGTTQFTEIWAPMDGFFFNAGLKIKL